LLSRVVEVGDSQDVLCCLVAVWCGGWVEWSGVGVKRERERREEGKKR
jgi:hypothetical protein